MFKDHNIISSATGVIFDIKRFAIHDGRGIRTTVFFKGCPLNCHWCHNPESQEKEPAATPAKKTIDQTVSVEYVMAEIEKDILFYDESRGGVTFSGGEPLMQPLFLKALLDECKKRDIHAILDTSGYASSHIFNSIIDKVDLFHYDLKLMDIALHQKYTGVPNQQINENLKKLSIKKKNVVIRFPVIPGITDTAVNLKEIAEFISSLKGINEIDLLPYHRTAAEKYRRLKKEYLLDGLNPPTKKKMMDLKASFEARGFKVKIGG
jgi:pyruvate formate lyase activating enzyme